MVTGESHASWAASSARQSDALEKQVGVIRLDKCLVRMSTHSHKQHVFGAPTPILALLSLHHALVAEIVTSTRIWTLAATSDEELKRWFDFPRVESNL